MVIDINTEQTPKEIVYRSKDNGCFHISSFDDMVLNPIEIGKIYYGLHIFDLNFQISSDSCQSQNTKSKVHTLGKSSLF